MRTGLIGGIGPAAAADVFGGRRLDNARLAGMGAVRSQAPDLGSPDKFRPWAFLGQSAIRPGEKEAVVALPESFLGAVKKGEAELTLWSAPEKLYRATLRELAPAADSVTRTFTARFSLPDADEKVALGMSGTLKISPRQSDPVARVPRSPRGSVRSWTAPPPEQSHAFARDDGSIARTPQRLLSFLARL